MDVTLDTLEMGAGSVEVRIEYRYDPGEPMVRYYPDGSGYPGCPADVELVNVQVTSWTMADVTRQRNDHWVWLLLDAYALAIVDQHWDDLYRDMCLEDNALRN